VAITVGTSSNSVNGTNVSTLNITALPSTSGTGIIVAVVWIRDTVGASTVSGITDNGSSGGNTYVQDDTATSYNPSAGVFIRPFIFHCQDTKGSVTTLTVSISGNTTANFVRAAAVEVIPDALTTLALDATALNANQQSGNPTSLTPGSINTSVNNSICVTCMVVGRAATINDSSLAVPTGFSPIRTFGGGITTPVEGGGAYEVFTSTQSGLNPAWTVGSSSAGSNTCIVTFKEVSGFAFPPRPNIARETMLWEALDFDPYS
jgi:hypothetical protein